MTQPYDSSVQHPDADRSQSDRPPRRGDNGEPVRYQGAGSDPTFGYLIALALAIGLSPLIPQNADLRLTVLWMVMGLFSVLAWLLGDTTRIGRDKAENLLWGVVFGAIVALPLLFAGGSALNTTVNLVFRTGIGGELRPLTVGSALALAVFAMPMAETLFFRGLMQYNRPFWLVGIFSTVWSLAVFFPALEINRFPVVAVIIGTALLLMNMIYSYVRQRNGLAAAWVCQIVVNLCVLVLPYVLLRR
jgi:hypothetical protein